ncbi:MAG: HAD domain-containing protein [Rhodoferax sp.]
MNAFVPALRPVLFLDLDDVLCLNTPYGGYDVIQALSEVQKKTATLDHFGEMWAQLFVPAAKARLQALDEEFSPKYVMSTSWRRFLDKHAFQTVLQCCELEFVSSKLHENWQTPSFLSSQLRSREVGCWFDENTEQRGNWVVLDDEHSGTGLDRWLVKEDLACIVLCRAGVGLTDVEYARLRAAFVLRIEQSAKSA